MAEKHDPCANSNQLFPSKPLAERSDPSTCLATVAYGNPSRSAGTCPINPFRNSSSTPLNAADISALSDATNRLLDKPHLVSGNTDTWQQPRIRSKRHGDRWQRDAPQGIGLPQSCALRSRCPARARNVPQRSPGGKTKDGWRIG